MVRYSLNFVSWKLRKAVAADLRTIYTAATIEEAEMRLVGAIKQTTEMSHRILRKAALGVALSRISIFQI